MKLPYQILTRTKFDYQESDEGKKWVAVKRIYKGKQYVKYEHVPKEEDKFVIAARLYTELLEKYSILKRPRS